MTFSVRASLEQFALPHPGGGPQLKVSVAAPAVPTTGAAVPVLYLVDADLLFGIAAEIARVMSVVDGTAPFYVVGVGYDAAFQDFMKLRTADLSPPAAGKALEDLGGLGAIIGADRNGGADAFLSLLIERLKPEIAARYPETAGGAEVLFGHSLGGLFTAHALLSRPDAFSAYIVGSPSLWWDGFSIFDKLPAFKGRLLALLRPPRVFVDVGAREQDLPTRVPAGIEISLEDVQAQVRAARMVDAAAEFAEALREAGVTTLRHVAFAEEDHSSAALGGLMHGMRFALAPEG